MALTAILRLINLAGSPTRLDDEGTYVAQAFALVEWGELAHYTYWYDHPPAGWLQLALWMVFAGPGFGDNAVVAGRYLMVIFAVITAGLLWILARRIGTSRWAAAAAHAVVPGYFAPRAERELLHVSADRRWAEISRTQRVLGWQLIGPGRLPPDWPASTTSATPCPPGPPAGGQAQFGPDAARLPDRFAESCDPADRALAAALRNLDGSAASGWQHPVALVAAAATDHAAGDPDAAAVRLDQAGALQQRYPTYFGSAWVALGRIMLATSLLGECPDNGERFLHRDRQQ